MAVLSQTSAKRIARCAVVSPAVTCSSPEALPPPGMIKLDVIAMLPEPARGAGMQRHIARSRFGFLAQGADALEGRPRIEVLPHDLVLPRSDGIDDLVCVVVGQVGARIERPGAVVEAGVVRLEAAVLALRHDHPAPTDLAELCKDLRLEGEGLVAGGECLLEPEREALVHDDVDRPVGDRLQAPRVARPAVELQASAPALHILQRIAVYAEHLVDEVARRVRLVFARRD